MIKETIQFPDNPTSQPLTTGTAGIRSQLPGSAATVSAMAAADGGIAPGHIIETDRG